MGRAQNHSGHLGRHSGSGKFKLKHEGKGEVSRPIMRGRTILAEGVTCAMAQNKAVGEVGRLPRLIKT